MRRSVAAPRTALRDDFELLGAWQTGNSDAGEALFERHYRSVAAFLCNKVPRYVEDLAQRCTISHPASRPRSDVVMNSRCSPRASVALVGQRG